MTNQPSLPAFDSLVLGAVAILGEATAAEVRRVVEGNWNVPQHIVDKALRRLSDQSLVQSRDEDGRRLFFVLDAGRFALAKTTEAFQDDL